MRKPLLSFGRGRITPLPPLVRLLEVKERAEFYNPKLVGDAVPSGRSEHADDRPAQDIVVEPYLPRLEVYYIWW